MAWYQNEWPWPLFRGHFRLQMTNRKWHMARRMVIWPMSCDLFMTTPTPLHRSSEICDNWKSMPMGTVLNSCIVSSLRASEWTNWDAPKRMTELHACGFYVKILQLNLNVWENRTNTITNTVHREPISTFCYRCFRCRSNWVKVSKTRFVTTQVLQCEDFKGSSTKQRLKSCVFWRATTEWWQRWSWRDVLRQNVPNTSGDERESSVTDSWQSNVYDVDIGE